MSQGNQIQAKITMPGSGRKDKTRKGPNRQLTLEIVSEWIKLQGMDEYTTNGLIELASNYPTNALPSFRKNFNLMIARVRQKRKEEQRNEPEVIQTIESQENGDSKNNREKTSSNQITESDDILSITSGEDQV